MLRVWRLAAVLSAAVAFRSSPPTAPPCSRRRTALLGQKKNGDRPKFDARFDGVGIPGSELGFVLFDAVRQGRSMKTGDIVIAGADEAGTGGVQTQSYELRRVYFQGVSAASGTIERVEVESLASPPPDGCEGYERYIELFSPRYHAESGPVVVRPDEARLVALRDEVTDSLWLAIPGLFWVYVAVSFFQYGQATGRM